MAYKTIGMMRNGGMQKDINDHMASNGTLYLLAKERAKYLVTVSTYGRLLQENFLLNTAGGNGGAFIFVMDGDGAIYSASKAVVHHHSSFLAGGPVAAAGHWKVEYGKPTWISNSSGHYAPPYDYAQQILDELKKRGVDVTGITTEWTPGTAAQLSAIAKSRNVSFQRLGPKGVETSYF